MGGDRGEGEEKGTRVSERWNNFLIVNTYNHAQGCISPTAVDVIVVSVFYILGFTLLEVGSHRSLLRQQSRATRTLSRWSAPWRSARWLSS